MLKGYYRHEKQEKCRPHPFVFNLSLQIQSIKHFLKKRRGYSFLNCLRTPLFKKSLNLHKCGHTTMFIGWRTPFSSQHHCTCCWLLLLRHSLHFQGWREKVPIILTWGNDLYIFIFLNKNNPLCKREWIQHTSIQHTY